MAGRRGHRPRGVLSTKKDGDDPRRSRNRESKLPSLSASAPSRISLRACAHEDVRSQAIERCANGTACHCRTRA